MISRSAEQCFWLFRHLERIDHISRFMSVNHNYILDTNLANHDKWFPFIILLGEEQRFLQLHGVDAITNGRLIQDYIVWEKQNPISIFQMTKAARENTRIIRDTISNEFWETINAFWLWLNSHNSYHTYSQDKIEFYKTVKQSVNSIYGQLYNSMLEGEAYHFMMLGMILERTMQTARILDIKSYRNPILQQETAIETLYWLNLLKFFSAHEAFLKQKSIINSKTVAEFLIFEKSFPHTIAYCLNKAISIAKKLSSITKESSCLFPIESIFEKVNKKNIQCILKESLNEFLIDIVNEVANVCEQIECTFFHPENLILDSEKRCSI